MLVRTTPKSTATRERKMKQWRLLGLGLFGLLLFGFVFFSQRTIAQDDGASDWDNSGSSRSSPPARARSSARSQSPSSSLPPSASSTICEPSCRSGYACNHGECLPECSRGCPAGTLCSEGGVCVSTEKQKGYASSNWSEDPDQCVPDCRTGYLCLHGQCVSKCNPVCFDGEICTDEGECVLRPQVEAPIVQRDRHADSIVNLHMDALGMLQFGLTPTLEIGKKFSGYLRVRPLNTGLASYYLLDRNHDDFQWGLGGALGMHVFSAGRGNMRGVFGGPALEYVFVRQRDGLYDRAVYGTHALIPQLDAGYRWAFGRLLLGLGGRVGLSIPVGAFDWALKPNGCTFARSCNEDRDLWFVAGIFLDIGIFL